MTDEMVSVPKALLAEVLDTAESDSYSTEAEFASEERHYARYAKEREMIRELRKTAGIVSNGVVGRGFFGIAAALVEQDDEKS